MQNPRAGVHYHKEQMKRALFLSLVMLMSTSAFAGTWHHKKTKHHPTKHKTTKTHNPKKPSF